MTTRAPMSKKTRFEVFKRDGFVCMYCGAHPPKVLLHVDHIVAVANGGGDDMDNLVTSCEACNLGKGARDLSVVPQSLADKAAALAEREEQLRGYHEIMQAREARLEDETWMIVEELEPGATSFGRLDLRSIRVFLERLDYFEVLEAARIASANMYYPGQKRFRYFCGVCWKKIRG